MELTEEKSEYYLRNPVAWIWDFLGAKLWSKQEEICEAVATETAVSCRSGHGVGKSFVSACIVLWYLFSNVDSKVVTTAPTFYQCKTILWSEIGKLHQKLAQRIDPAGHLTLTELKLAPGWWATARSTDEPNNFIGTHEENLLVVFDEASGISRAIFDAAKGLTTGKSNKILMIGNPTDPGGYFHDTHTGEVPGFKKIKISVFDCPNIRKNPITRQWEDALDENGNLPFPALTSLDWVEDMRRTYGERSAMWQAKVLGEFPESAADQLISGRHIAAAVQKGMYLREVVEGLEEGSEMLSSKDIVRIVGR